MAFGISQCSCRYECGYYMNYDKFKKDKEMGLKPSFYRPSNCNCESTNNNKINTNTIIVPENFNIEISTQIENYLILIVEYPNCSNYEGLKILVYENVTIEDINKLNKIDPHFCEKCLSPIARFVPTMKGYKMAKMFCESMVKK